MAVTGTFIADFASFNTAVQEAEVKLRSFEGSSNKVETALNRMTDSFSGRKVIQDATLMVEAIDRVGGTSNLTEKELARVSATVGEAAAKMRAMGIDVPPGIQKIADATKNAEEASIDWGSALSTASGVLAAFGVSASISGLVAIGKAIFEDADALTKMSDKTNITAAGLQAMRIAGDDAGVSLESMTSAVNMLQKRLGGDDASALAALRDLGIETEKFKRLDGAAQMSAIANAVKEIHDPLRVANDLSGLFGKSWSDQVPVLKRGFHELTDGTQVMSDASTAFLDRIGDAATNLKRTLETQLGEGTAIVLAKLTGHWEEYAKAVDEAKNRSLAVTPVWGALNTAMLPIGPTASEITALEKELNKTLEEQKKIVADGAAEIKRLADISQHLIGGDDIKRAEDYMIALRGVSDVSKLTADRQEEINKALNKALDAFAAMGATAPPEMSRMEEATRKAAGGMLEFLKIGEQVNDTIFPPALTAKAQAFGDELQGLVVIGRSVAESLADIPTSFNDAMKLVSQGKGSLGGSVQAAQTPAQLAKKAADAGGSVAYDDYGNGYVYIPGVNLPGRASGGPVSSGQPYMVGERGPELFIPSSNGAIRPNGGGGTTTIIVNAQGAFFDTPEGMDRLARVVGNAVTRRQMSIGASL